MAVTLDPSAPVSARTHRGALSALSAAFLIGVVFIVKAAIPYFVSFTEAQYGPHWSRRWGLVAHITMGIVALLSGPIQLWLGITDRRPLLHRRLGYVYLMSVALGAGSAYYLSFTSTFGIAFASGLMGLATAWVITTGLAFTAITRRLYDQHKEWMIRSYVVTTAFVTFRAVLPLLQSSGIAEAGAAATISAWGCWALPLLITEAVLQGRKILAVRPT